MCKQRESSERKNNKASGSMGKVDQTITVKIQIFDGVQSSTAVQ